MPRRHRWLADAVRSRVLVNLLLVAVAAIAVLAGVLGPLLVRAVDQFTVQEAVSRAGADGTAVTVSLQFDGNDPTTFVQSAETVLQSAGSAGLWRPPQVWTESTENLAWARAGGSSAGTQPAEHSSRVRLALDECAGLVLVAGRCPTQLGQAAVSTGDAEEGGVRVGSIVTLRPPVTTIGPGSPPITVKIVGTYDPDRSELPRVSATDTGATTALPIVLSTQQTAAAQVPIQVLGRIDLTAGIGVQDEPAARASIAAMRDAVLRESNNVTVSTGLIDLLDHADAQVRSAALLIAVTEVQALALGLFALAVVLQRIALTRAAEWGIGRLRGVPRRRWYTSIYVEPGAALIAGSLVGFAAGLFVARLSVTASLGASTPVEPWRWPVLLAAFAVVLSFLVALVAVSAPSLRRPLVELIQQRSESRQLGVVGAVAQAAVLLLAAATLYQLLAGGVLSAGGSQLGLLAPALLALSLALIAVRIAVVLVRRVTARAPRRLTSLIVGRQAARTPSSLNPAVVVTVGTALAVFATQLLLVSTRNQDLRATATVGAQTVLQVEPPFDTSLLSLVRAADPSGRYAMAVQQRSVDSDTGVGRVIAVDASRLSAVAAWSSSWSGAPDLSALQAPTAKPVTITGRRIEVTLDDVQLKPGVVSTTGTAPADPHLLITVATGNHWKTVDLGSISSRAPHRAALPCAKGCGLVNIGVRSEAGAAYTADLTVASVTTDQQPAAVAQAWLHSEGWHARVGDQLSGSPRAQATPSITIHGLHLITFDQDGGNPAVALPADAVDPLPALVAPATAALPFPGIPNAVIGRGLDGQPQLLQVVGNASVLPRLLDNGVLVDLSSADKLADPSKGQGNDEVWLAPGAPPQIEQALVAAGVTVTGREELAVQQQDLQREPSTRSAAAARLLGLTALALTLVALVAARAVDVSRRRPDWRSLLDGGLPARAVRRLAFTEISVPVVSGALLGIGSGVLGFVLARSRLPLVDLTTPGPPLDLRIAWLPVAVLGIAVLIVILIVSAVAARIETRTPGGRR